MQLDKSYEANEAHYYIIIDIFKIKFQQLTMKLLSGRFPHLVEGILGLLDGKTLFQCSQVNKTWNKDLETHRLHLVRKTQRHLIIPTIVYDKVCISKF